MTVTERAAKVWAALERHLIERCGLPDGHMLDVNRPYLIRWIGDRLKAVPVDVDLPMQRLPAPPVKKPVVTDAGRATVTVDRMTAGGHAPTFHDPRLAAMLERSCSLRGYDEDEPVIFAPYPK